MDAYEEAKNEHFESIRINIGHPSYQTQLVDLQSREAERLVSFIDSKLKLYNHRKNT